MLWRVRAVATLDRFCCLLDLKATLHFRDSEGCEVNEGEKGGRGEERGEKRRKERRKKTPKKHIQRWHRTKENGWCEGNVGEGRENTRESNLAHDAL